MLNIYARSFLEASRFTANTRPAPSTQQHLDRQSAQRKQHTRLWLRPPYWI
jgi:hypothetical protein